MNAVVLIGGGGHARVVASMLSESPGTRCLGYTDHHDRGNLEGLAYLGADDSLTQVRAREGAFELALGIGHVGVTDARAALVTALEARGFNFCSVVSARAAIAPSARIGAGSVVMPGAVVNAGAQIDRYAIVNSNATVEHGCTIGAHSHIAPGAVVCGDAHVGRACLIGAGAVIIQGLEIADACLIGAGAVVCEHIADRGAYAGCPARRMRE